MVPIYKLCPIICSPYELSYETFIVSSYNKYIVLQLHETLEYFKVSSIVKPLSS